MKLQQLRYLQKVVALGNITEAAKELFIAQPTLTSAVRDVESELGIQIFHRTHKGVTPTVEGEDFLGKIRRVYQQYEEVLAEYGDDNKFRRKFAVSMQHYSFAVKAFIAMAKHYDANQFDLTLRETTTANVIRDVSNMKSEIGIIYTSEGNQRVINRLLRENELDFTSIIECPASVYIARSHPLANEKELTFDQLDPYPCLSFEQENETDIFFAEEILIEQAYQKTIKATDRATMLSLIEELNGYTFCSSIFSERLSGDRFVVIPFKGGDVAQRMMNIGFITKKNCQLSSMGKKFLEEVSRELALDNL